MLSGFVPKTKDLPYEWYDTPNIRVLSIKDFRKYSSDIGFDVLKEIAVSPYENNTSGKIIRVMPNLFATYGIFLIGSKKKKG